jgi:hypothetical protein
VDAAARVRVLGRRGFLFCRAVGSISACGPREEKLAWDLGEALRAGEERGKGRKEELTGGDSRSAGEREGRRARAGG